MIRPYFSVFTALGSAALALCAGGCDKPQIRVYTVAKEAPPATPAPTAATASAERERPQARPRPQITYTLPSGWKESEGSPISFVNFLIKTDEGQATVNITALAGMQGNEAAIVNMWRTQVNQPVLSDQEIAAGFTPVQVADGSGKLFEVTGVNDSKALRIVTAFTHRGGQTWFYKLQGDETVVAAQKTAFLEFLKSVKIKEPSATASADAPSTEPPATPAMVAPEGWQALPPGQMQIAKFAVKTDADAKAEVSVSIFPSDTGGTLANVNRWRRQLGLADVDEAALQECVTPLEGASIDGAPGAILADLSHEGRRMLGAIVPRDGRWWFYKMLGDAAAVNAERENFVNFVKTQP